MGLLTNSFVSLEGKLDDSLIFICYYSVPDGQKNAWNTWCSINSCRINKVFVSEMKSY